MRQQSKRSATLEQVSNKFLELGSTLLNETYAGSRSPLKYTCSKCTTESQTRWDHVSKKKAPFMLLCGKCRALSGVNHPQYKPMAAHRSRAQKLPEILTWYTLVCRKFESTCVVSGIKGNVSAHHLYSMGSYPDKALDVRNGVTLTKPLHKEFHDRFGYGANTLYQFQTFFKEKTGRDFEDPFEGYKPHFVEGSRLIKPVTKETVYKRFEDLEVHLVDFTTNRSNSYPYKVHFDCIECGQRTFRQFWQVKIQDNCRCPKCLSNFGRRQKNIRV